MLHVQFQLLLASLPAVKMLQKYFKMPLGILSVAKDLRQQAKQKTGTIEIPAVIYLISYLKSFCAQDAS